MLTSVLIFFVGLIAGFIGAFGGGGGGFLSLGAMLYLNIPPSIAIATNRFATLGMSSAAIARYIRSDKFIWSYAIILCLFGVIGGFLGSFVLLNLNEDILEYIIIACLLILAPMMLLKPNFGTTSTLIDPKSPKAIFGYVVYTILMIITAFSGPGIGILFLFANIYFFGFTIIQSNATGMPSFWLMNLVSFCIFAWNGLIDWEIAIALIAGSLIGGWLGASYALSKGERAVKLAVVIISIAMGAVLLFK